MVALSSKRDELYFCKALEPTPYVCSRSKDWEIVRQECRILRHVAGT